MCTHIWSRDEAVEFASLSLLILAPLSRRHGKCWQEEKRQGPTEPCPQGGQVLTGVLAILGHSLECYSCINPVISCDINMTCSYNFDACILVKAGRHYYQCWRMEHCEWDYISSALGETKLTYECCQKDLCNTEKEESDTSHFWEPGFRSCLPH
uniref:CD59 glycoprotein n=1 Tax=Equus asinus asinus TaxID=83772 RepID=A0A8C4MN22_EQUAS